MLHEDERVKPRGRNLLSRRDILAQIFCHRIVQMNESVLFIHGHSMFIYNPSVGIATAAAMVLD